MVVLFVMSIFVLTGITAVVVDISWYWANTLRVQRAADAAALAGVVWLPGAPGTAYSTARTEATKNGYTDGAAGVTVFPIQDSGNDRRLDVTISAPVDTFFMKIFGIQTIQAIRTSKADFILPVPMGSPEQWYGIGNYEVFSPGPPHTRGPAVPTNTAGPNNWTNGPDGRTNNSVYATTGNTTSMQGYRDFGLGVPGADTIDGIQIRVDAKSTDSVGCRLGVSLSWDNGTTWSSERFVDLTNNDPTTPFLVAGGPTTLWAGHTWIPADFSDANFRVRVRADNAGANEPPASNCRSGATTSLDFFDVTVYSTGPGTSAATNVPTPGGEALAPTSQGFWGAIFTRGGVRRNGDRYSPEHFDPGVPNAEYLPQGYDYTIEFGSGGGRVNLFDPVFCATGANASGSWYGAGDHWTTQSSSNSTPDPGGPVTTVFTLYDEGNTPYDPTDDVVVARLVEGGQRQADQSGRVGTQNAGRAALPDCASDPHHDQWVRQDAWTTPGASSLPAGRYRLNVDTSQGANVDTGAENMWSIYVGDSGPAGSARVYGGGRMVGYNNITSTSGYQRFYLAQVEAVHAGKTMVIELFDPGDVGQNAWIRVLSPDNNVYSYATFDYTSDGVCVNGRSDSCAGTGRTQIQTYRNGSGSSFDNSVITLEIPLPSNYGSNGLNPPGDVTDEPGWWQIEYQVGAANDTTTWRVSIRGNPVHLVIP
ncbi:MAG TPA: pilus assembly protein TadG-related protein [Patescibacteria group bacterium]|nr:pilus assembly protein TadG-related protein [Patescibacteria group bacterium]